MERGTESDVNRAIESLDEAISLQQDYASAYVNRAGAYIVRMAYGDVDRALNDIETALEIEPDNAAAHLNRGNAYIARGSAGDMHLALVEYSTAIELEPSSALAHFNRGLVHSELGDLARSVTDVRSAQELSPDEVVYNRTLCWQLAVNGNADEGRDFCKLALDYDPDGLSRDAMGLANSLTGRRQLAIADFESFIKWVGASSKPTCESQYRNSRLSWINSLRAGDDPFDRSTLYDLRARPVPLGTSPC